MTHIEELKETIRRLHGVESRHIESIPVKETFRGETVWEGVVEVFELIGHPRAQRLYAWTYKADGKERHITVLHMDKVTSPLLAVRAAIVQEFRAGESEAEA
jgi:hypothetical protein